MKKLVSVIALAAVLTACGSNEEKSDETKIDSINTESPLMDAVNTKDSVGKILEAVKDSAGNVIEKPAEQ